MSNTVLLNALTSKGVLVNVHVRYWRARKKLTPEDLGLSAEQVDDRLFSLGHKRLLPKEALKRLALLEGRAHALVEENTFPFLNGIGHYLPNSKLAEVTARLDELRSEFAEAQAQFMDRYGELRNAALANWTTAARKLGVDPQLLVAKIRAAFPPPESLSRYFGFAVNLYQISVPDVPQAELIELGAQQELAQARREAAEAARREIEQSCQGFIADCVATLREQTAKLCEDMLATINDTGYVHQKTLNRLLKFIERFGELNFVNDAEMKQQLEQTRKEFLSRTAPEYRDSNHARQQLVKGLEGLRNKAREMAGQDTAELVSSFGKLGKRKFNFAA